MGPKMTAKLIVGRPSGVLVTLIIFCVVQCTRQLSTTTSGDAVSRLNKPHHGVLQPLSDNHKAEQLQRRKRFMINNDAKRWTKYTVPYKFAQTVERNKKDIVAAMAFYEYLTPMRFEEWDASRTKDLGHSGFISFHTTWGRGWSLLGLYNYSGGQNLDCPRQRTCVHELGHAFGFEHEQTHPERDRWVAVNMPKVQYELDSWNTIGWGNKLRTHFDYSSFMLYPPTFVEYDVLFPELFPFQQRPFYMLKELCTQYNCDQAPQCVNEQLTCGNEGYVSVVDGHCSCVCLPGLDPETSCTTIIGNGHGKWPAGTFSFLEHKDGCPNGYFQEGTLTHYSTGDNRLVSSDFKGELSGHKAELSFCTQTSDSLNGMWPLGSYCFFKKGSCPKQRGFYEGKIELVGDYTNYKDNAYSGHLPNGDTGLDPSMEYCCVHSGFPYIPIDLPNDKPFILLARKDQECQQVTGMSVKMEKLGLYSPRVFGDVKYEWDGRTALVYYCVYTPADRQCGDIVELGPAKRSVTIESDRSNPSNRECDWLFKTAPGAKGRIVLTLDEFNVPCPEYFEIQHTMIAQIGVSLCGDIKDRSAQSLYDKLRVQFKTLSNSQSHFKATVKWIPDNELCYDASRDGATYRGDVSYTRDFEPCLPWSEVGQCLVVPNRLGFFLSDLDGNKCRNPDNSFYPWCYTKLEGCKRNFCDVCQLEKPYDTADDCADRKRRGDCNTDSLDCAATCAIVTQGPDPNAKPVTCGQPPNVDMGRLQGTRRSSYDIGDTLTYECERTQNTIKISCQGDGQWSTAGTACLPCPEGYTHYRDSCYKFVNKFMKYSAAEDYCSSLGNTELAIPRNQGENDFMRSFKYPLDDIWIGASLNDKKFETQNGEPITWFNWRWYDVPHPERCVFMRGDGFWKDVNACDWEMNFMCRIKVTDDYPPCKDFLDDCPSLVREVKDSNCALKPGLETYCRHTCGLCPLDCKQDVQLTQTNRQYDITADRSTSSHRYCTWTIKPPSPNGRLVLKFSEFDVPSNGDDCMDGVEVKSKIYGPPYERFCNAHYNKTVIITNDQMLVRFIAPEKSQSRFKAHVEWIPDGDMCYNVQDKGWSYDGTVNYTRTFEECLPWTDVLNCVNNTLWNGYLLENLNENFCRNPRPEEHNEQPYCYTKDCVKKYCDVCLIEKPSDNSTDCQDFKRSGKCQSDPLGAATKCAETCSSDLEGTKVKVSQVSCPRPGRISDGTLESPANSYKVGDRAKYKCNTRDFYIERTCHSSGTWSTAHTACLDCPFGFIPYKDQCYKYFPLYVDKDGANDHCQLLGGKVATPKNADQNHFIASIRENERIWLGGYKETYNFVWNDGTAVGWDNWLLAKRKYKYRDYCMVLEKNELWTDDWCRDKLFHFVCQVKPQNEEKVCVDFLDSCPELIQAVPNGDCTNFPSLQLDCRSSCGLCLSDCKKNIRLTSDNQIYTATHKQGFCTWNFQGDGKPGRFIVTIENFKIQSPNSLIMTLSSSDGFLHKFADRTYQKVTYVYEDHLTLKFKGKANTDSNFKATVRYVKDSDMCYDVKGKGLSYVGKVTYTKTYHKCMPWAQTSHCKSSPISPGDFLDNLDGNYCRNPDGSDRPWCYTSSCEKQTCDVCHLEKLEDIGNDCAARKSRGECTMESMDCAKTCELDKNVRRVSSTKCGFPSQVSEGQFQGPYKNQFQVGDRVTYKCTKSSFTVDRVCLSDGTWSVAGTACLGCPLDSYEFHGQCYKYIEKGLNYTQAKQECEKYGQRIATPRSSEENVYLASLKNTANKPTRSIWLGAKRDTKKMGFYWNDNTRVDWTNWSERKKIPEREDCIRMSNGVWYDDWCHDKQFNVVCQQKSYDEPECKDFLDDCPHRLTLTHKQMCEPHSRMESLCRRTCGLCPKDCDHTVELSQTVPSYEIVSDRRKDSSRYCTWQFTVPQGKKGRFAIQFEDYEIPAHNWDCIDMLEVKDSVYGSPHTLYCNPKMQNEMEVLGDSLFIRFRTIPKSQSHFKATVTWIDDDSMCYNTKDNGRSYSGDVNYTSDLKSCISWGETQHCDNHPLKEGSGNLISHLHGNACRNPDNSERPWCYTQGCYRQFCDVCHLEKPFDRDSSDYCKSFKASGECDSDPNFAIERCAATCNVVPSSQSAFRAIDVTCESPKAVSGAVLTTPKQATYRVGDVATYKCSRSTSVVSSVCLTTGKWSDANTPCLACPSGWSQFGDKCYRYIKQFLEYVDAVAECKKLSAIVAPVKTKAVSDFIDTLRNRNEIWIGAKKTPPTNQFQWSDGDSFSWTNWMNPSKAMAKRDECILYTSQWKDDWCHDKFFPFVCQMDSDANPDCVDFMDSCTEHISYMNNKQCNGILNKYCRKSCGLCNN